MPLEFAALRKTKVRSERTHEAVATLAEQLRAKLSTESLKHQIDEVHKLGASSAKVQAVILPAATSLGFSAEKTGLFKTFKVPALRPDYFVRVADTGVILEVERGKTTTNNMDLLDFWKCHICAEAEYLFLLVPNARRSESGRVLRHFKQVQNRLSTFFEAGNYVNVEGVFIFGYGEA